MRVNLSTAQAVTGGSSDIANQSFPQTPANNSGNDHSADFLNDAIRVAQIGVNTVVRQGMANMKFLAEQSDTRQSKSEGNKSSFFPKGTYDRFLYQALAYLPIFLASDRLGEIGKMQKLALTTSFETAIGTFCEINGLTKTQNYAKDISFYNSQGMNYAGMKEFAKLYTRALSPNLVRNVMPWMVINDPNADLSTRAKYSSLVGVLSSFPDSVFNNLLHAKPEETKNAYTHLSGAFSRASQPYIDLASSLEGLIKNLGKDIGNVYNFAKSSAPTNNFAQNILENTKNYVAQNSSLISGQFKGIALPMMFRVLGVTSSALLFSPQCKLSFQKMAEGLYEGMESLMIDNATYNKQQERDDQKPSSFVDSCLVAKSENLKGDKIQEIERGRER